MQFRIYSSSNKRGFYTTLTRINNNLNYRTYYFMSYFFQAHCIYFGDENKNRCCWKVSIVHIANLFDNLILSFYLHIKTKKSKTHSLKVKKLYFTLFYSVFPSLLKYLSCCPILSYYSAFAMMVFRLLSEEEWLKK